MAIVTTYVCDVTGRHGTDKADFINVKITADNTHVKGLGYSQRTLEVSKLVHIDIARTLNLVHSTVAEAILPEVTFESKLTTLLRDFVEEIAYEAGQEAASNYNRGG